jgi:hypothetical protein
MDPKEIVVTLRLRFDMVNFLLGKLGACPFNEVADLIAIIRQHTTSSIEAHQAAQQVVRPPAMPGAPPNGTGTPMDPTE